MYFKKRTDNNFLIQIYYYNNNRMSPDESEQFLQSCRECDIVRIERFLDDGLININCSDAQGDTPLQITSAYGYLELVIIKILKLISHLILPVELLI